MSGTPNTPGREPEEENTPQEPYVPASPFKRTLAWMGVVYMVIIVILTTYNLATGAPLRGAPGIMIAPACGALAVLSFLRFKAEGRGAMVFVGIVAAIACIVNLVLGVAALAGG